MKPLLRRTAITSIAILFLLGGTTAAFAEGSGYSHGQTLTATMVGQITNLGTQNYNVRGGQVVFAMIAGQPVSPTTATIQYSFSAKQDGFSTSGYAHLRFSGTAADGTAVTVSGDFGINGIVPVTQIPIGCTTSCTSELPFYFLASSSSVQMTVEGGTQTVAETMQIESPYFNPFGAPIILASADNSIVIAATYTRGSITWTGTQIGGTLSGTLAGTQSHGGDRGATPLDESGSTTQTTPVSGTYSLSTYEVENLMTGTTIDSGTISWTSMTPSSLNARGYWGGNSSIPASPTQDCSPVTLPGTCTMTGFQSLGKFHMGGVSGAYATTWGLTALTPVTTMTASVSQNSGD